MKILHVGKYYPPYFGGIENFMSDVMLAQVAQGHDVEALVHQHQKRTPFSYESETGGNIYRVPILGTVIYVPIAPLFGFYLSRILKHFHPDVLHLHMPNLSCFWLLLSIRARKTPWVVHWHSDVLGAVPDLKVKFLYPIYRIFESWLLSRAEKIIVTSPEYLASSKALAAFTHKCTVVPLGISDKSHFPVQPKAYATKALELLCVGRLTYYKGHKYLLQAIASLKNNGVSVHLTIVGTGELGKSLKALVTSLGIDCEVEFLGRLSNSQLEHELNGCHLLCLPSIERTEAFGLVLLEAMRAGKPCIVTDVLGSGMNWVVQNEQTGIVVKSGDANALVEVFSRLNTKRELLIEYGKNGRTRFEQEFIMDRVNEKILSLYNQILSREGGEYSNSS